MHRIAIIVIGLLVAHTAAAHVSIASGPAFANKSQKITFSIGHGCDGADTVALTIDIPAGVSSVRPMFSDFGKPSVTKDPVSGVITSVTWTKSATDALADDSAFYEITLRGRVPDVAFSKLMFVAHQTCRDVNGVETVVHWDQPPGSMTGEPAPLLTVVPARLTGWNKVVLGATITVAAADLPTYFADAQIVWRGAAAYSSNPNTMTQIGATTGVTVLATDLVPNDEIWVKY